MPSPLVFLSYARRQPDESWASRVVNVLSGQYGLDVWFDKRGLSAGRPFDEEIDGALQRCQGVILLGSSASLTSPYCRHECDAALSLGKPFIPLFIEAVGWPETWSPFQRLHYEQLFRAGDDQDLAAMVGHAVLNAGLPIDPANIPPRRHAFDQWAGSVHPEFGVLRAANDDGLRKLIEDCSLKLGLRKDSGYHNMNLALILLHMKDCERAWVRAEAALFDLPGHADANYFCALIAAAREPLGTAPRARIQRIVDFCQVAIRLGQQGGATSSALPVRGLPVLLLAIVAHEHFARNGLRSPVGEPESLFAEALRLHSDTGELDRMLSSLHGLSEASVQRIKRSQGAVA